MVSSSTGETRADVARRRLAELAAAFDVPPPVETESVHEESTVEQVGNRSEVFSRAARVGRSHLRALATVVAAVLVILAWFLLQSGPEEQKFPLLSGEQASVEKDGGNESGVVEAEPAELVVDVTGKVRKPGIVVLPVGSRVHEAIAAAGGTKGDVDLSGLNLARVLSDGEQVRVGLDTANAEGADAASTTGATSGSGGGPVNLNTAGATELETLPGVGPATAAAIIDWRTRNGGFRTVDDLLDVRGIGEVTLERLRELVRV